MKGYYPPTTEEYSTGSKFETRLKIGTHTPHIYIVYANKYEKSKIDIRVCMYMNMYMYIRPPSKE